MNSFYRAIIEAKAQGKVLVSDGAWGTFLHQRGLEPGDCPEAWNLSRPSDVAAVARSYVEAGSDMILTNSFGGNPFRLAHFGEEARCFELNKAAAEISRAEASRSGVAREVFVAGSIGPSGRMLAMGDVTEQALYEGFRLQAEGLLAGGAQGFCVETMSDPVEAACAIRAADDARRAAAAEKGWDSESLPPVFCTFTFAKTSNEEFRTMTGAGVKEAILAAKEAGASVIGTNCGGGFTQMIEIVREIRSFDAGTAVLVHANAGLPRYEDGKTIFPEGPEYMASIVGELVAAGANIVGGCCGTGPDHIRAFVRALERSKLRARE
jgi:5-methyltetrahydrofolate--homocysteine methyltransferase